MADEEPGYGLRGRDLAGIGGILLGAVVLGLVLGVLVDDRAGTAPVFSLVGVFGGIIAGGVGFWLRVRAALRPPGDGG